MWGKGERECGESNYEINKYRKREYGKWEYRKWKIGIMTE